MELQNKSYRPADLIVDLCGGVLKFGYKFAKYGGVGLITGIAEGRGAPVGTGVKVASVAVPAAVDCFWTGIRHYLIYNAMVKPKGERTGLDRAIIFRRGDKEGENLRTAASEVKESIGKKSALAALVAGSANAIGSVIGKTIA